MRFNHLGVIGEITSLPGSSQVCIFHDVFVKPESRGKGFGTEAHKMRLREACNLGYQLALCTVKGDNMAQKTILTKAGWVYHTYFNSDKTGNAVELWSRVL